MTLLRCKYCGKVFDESKLEYVTVYEDYGDVSCLKCPECGEILYDGMEFDSMFENVTGREL